MRDLLLPLLPLPGVAEGVGEGGAGRPAEDTVGARGVGPDLLDVALAPAYDLIRYTDTGGLLERPDQLQDGHAAACAEIEDLERLCGLPLDEPTDGLNMRTSQIDDVDIVSDTGAIGRVVVVAEDT